jgi:hypothetical protein
MGRNTLRIIGLRSLVWLSMRQGLHSARLSYIYLILLNKIRLLDRNFRQATKLEITDKSAAKAISP